MSSASPDQTPQTTKRKRRRWPWMLLGLGVLSLPLIASTGWLAAFGAAPRGERLARVLKSKNFGGGIFHNLTDTPTQLPGSTWRMLSAYVGGHEERTPSRAIPTEHRAKADYLPQLPAGVRATWIGHATSLVEIDGRRVLFDPIWSERGSPSTWVGPRRFMEPPIALLDLPPLDAVIISHDHYDHLDMQTIKDLNVSQSAMFVVPLGVGAHLEKWGVAPERIAELDWGEKTSVSGLELIAQPARHFSGRGLTDRDTTLWASWVVIGPAHRVYFSGDTGYFDRFREIGEAYGPFDLSLIKIGAYGETWPAIHVTPEQAIQAHLDLRAKVLLPVHWCTFNLAMHAWNEPAERLVAEAKKRGATVVVPRPGQMVDLGALPDVSKDLWWQ